MNSIVNRLSGDHNVGSLTTLLYIEKEGVSGGLPVKQVTLKDTVINLSDLTINAGYQWLSSEYEFDTPLAETDEESTPNGVLYKHKISFTIAKHYTQRRPDFDDMEYREFVVYAEDFNGVGTLYAYSTLDGQTCGMRFSKKKSTGAKRTALNQYTPAFYWESFCQAWPAVNDL